SYHVTEDHKKSYPLMSWTKQAYVQIDLVGSYTAVAGCCIYTGGAWPEKWNGSAFCSEPTINIVHHDFLKPTGTTYLATREKEEEFIGSRDLWFRPIHTRVGPDGALYLVDFSNQAVVHNDTRGTRHGANKAAVRPDRDHYSGRIWRVQHRQAKELSAPRLDQASAQDLVKALNHPNRWVRITAQRLLAEKQSRDREGAVRALLDLAGDDKSPAYGRIHALWTLENLQTVNAKLLDELIADSAPALRKNALRVVAEGASDLQTKGDRVEDLNKMKQRAASRLRDSEPRVRLEALLALGALDVDSATAREVAEV